MIASVIFAMTNGYAGALPPYVKPCSVHLYPLRGHHHIRNHKKNDEIGEERKAILLLRSKAWLLLFIERCNMTAGKQQTCHGAHS